MSAKVLLKLCMPCTGADLRESDGMLALATSSVTGELWDGEVSVVDIYEGVEKTVLGCPCGVSAARWHCGSSGNSDRVLGGGDDGRLYVWSVSDTDPKKTVVSPETEDETEVSRHNPQAALAAHDDAVSSVSVQRATGDVATGSWDSTVRLWDVGAERPINTFAAPACAPSCALPRVNGVQWSPAAADTLAAVMSDGRLHLWDKRTLGGDVRTVKVSAFSVQCAAWSDDGTTLAVGDEDGWVTVLDVRSVNRGLEGKPLFRKQDHTMAVSALAFSPNFGTVLASGGEDNKICVTDVRSGEDKYVAFGTIDSIAPADEGDPIPGHTAFVGALSWVKSNPNTLLSAGWDFRVINHTLDNLP